MLPGMDGFMALKEIRKTKDIPVIMLTARGEVTDRIVGLELGADDYLPKPFEPRELVARIQTVLRRISEKIFSARINYGELTVDEGQHLVLLNDERVDLTTMEFDMLLLFSKNPGRVLTRNQIMDSLRGYEWEAFDRSIDVLLSRLRQKLNDDPKRPKYIRTVWGKGYQFIGGEREDS
jgi:two-component system phosphate regulon response regulator OmpR